MELWLLVGALVLIALTVWIVWSPQSNRDAEVSPVNDMNKSAMPPQGDKFEDQYTSATADLSAGGVATTRDVASSASEAVAPPTERAGTAASEAWSSPGLAREGTTQPWSAGGTANVESTTGQRGMMPQKKTMGIGATTLVAVGGGIGGAWLYQRWQRERNKPINRLRRGALDLAGRLGERMPATDDLPGGRAPIGGGAVALLLSAVIISRALRRASEPTPEMLAEQSRGLFRNAVTVGKHEANRRMEMLALERRLEDLRKRGRDVQMPTMPSVDVPRQQAMFGGLGVGGLMLVGGACWLIWRVLRGGGHAGESYSADRAST
jgi:hypothetical protein